MIFFMPQFVLGSEEGAKIYSLEESVKAALENNWSVKAREEKILESEYAERSARAGFYPEFSTNYTYTRLNEVTSVKIAGRGTLEFGDKMGLRFNVQRDTSNIRFMNRSNDLYGKGETNFMRQRGQLPFCTGNTFGNNRDAGSPKQILNHGGIGKSGRRFFDYLPDERNIYTVKINFILCRKRRVIYLG